MQVPVWCYPKSCRCGLGFQRLGSFHENRQVLGVREEPASLPKQMKPQAYLNYLLASVLTWFVIDTFRLGFASRIS